MSGLCVLLPGQGGQHPAMFEKLEDDAQARALLDQASEIFDFDPRSVEEAELYDNRRAQLLLCAVELATWRALESRLPPVTVFAGYSAGELPAYACAGSLSSAEMLRLAKVRTELMDRDGSRSGLVAVVGLRRERIVSLCAEHSVEIAIINAPDHFILGGSVADLENVEHTAVASGAHTVRRLRVGVAAHTTRLSKAGEDFRRMLAQSDFRPPLVPVLAGIDGSPVYNSERAIATLSAQLYQPVNWAGCMRSAEEAGCRVFLELGPGNALSRMIEQTRPTMAVRSVDEFRSLDGAAAWTAKALERI